MTNFSRQELNALCEVKLKEVKARFVTMEQHADLRKLVDSSIKGESVHNLMKTYAIRLAKIELMGL